MKNGYGEITLYIYSVGLWFLCTALPLTAIIFSWTSPGHVAFENGQALIFIRQARTNQNPQIQNLLTSRFY